MFEFEEMSEFEEMFEYEQMFDSQGQQSTEHTPGRNNSHHLSALD
jgi:hypothetical protein